MKASRPQAGRRAVPIAFILSLCGAPAGIAAAPPPPPIPMRVAVHDGYTRLVFDFGAPSALAFHRNASVVTLDFSQPGIITPPPGFDAAAWRNLRAATFGDGRAVLTLQPGVTVHTVGQGTRRVVDLIDPPALPTAKPLTVMPIAVATLPPSRPPAKMLAAPDPARVDALPSNFPTDAAEPVSPSLIATVPPVTRTEDAPSEPPARMALAVASGRLVLPFPAGTGAAAFRRGETEIVVFDTPRVIDPATLAGHPELPVLSVQQLPQAVMLRIGLAAGQSIRLDRDGTDWSIGTVPKSDAGHPAAPAAPGTPMLVATTATSMRLAGDGANRVIVVPDPLSGDNLLVGTETLPGARVSAGRHAPPLVLLPTDLGAVVAPLADRVALRVAPDGFVIDSDVAGTPLALSPTPADTAPALAASRLGRSFDLPPQSAPLLLRRLHGQIADAAAAPQSTRLPYRRQVAQTLVALGMGAEAQAVLTIAATDDPRALTDPMTQALSGAAALLAGRLAEAGGLTPAASAADSDELRLWRALLTAAVLPDQSIPDAPTLAAIQAGLPLLMAYPPTLQRSLLPLAADALLRGHRLDAADRLLAANPGDPSLALARAASLQAHGQDAAALLVYDRLATGRDRSAGARAAVAAIDLRVAHGKLTPAQAGDAADPLIYAWRGDARELALRLKVAAWRGRAGQFRQQLESLRDTLQVFPEPTDGVQAMLDAAFAAMVHDDAADRLSPLDLVTLVQENADLMPEGDAGEAMVGKLADRLAALDLPQQAATVLSRLLHDTRSASARAAFGVRLAETDLAENQPQLALDALARSSPAQSSPESSSEAISPQLAERRSLLAARAHAALGDRTAALTALAPLADGPALLARAEVHEAAHEWPAAEAALAAFVAQSLPDSGRLDAAQSGVVLRLASATAQAGDDAGLARLHGTYDGRLPDANDAALLGMLTASPVRSVADLPRAAKELAAARSVPAELQAMAHTP